jgi:hypothetical protein
LDEKPTTTAMTKADFEKRFLTLVYQTDTVITAPNIAYHLSIPIEEAQEQLLALELNGTLQQATDAQGGTYYLMPNRPAPGTMPIGEAGATRGPTQSAPGVVNPADLPAIPIYSNPGAKGMNINGLVLNCVVPGAGSLVCGKMIGIAMMALALLGIIMFFLPLGFGRLAGVLPILIAYIWSIVAGVGLMGEKERGPGVPS